MALRSLHVPRRVLALLPAPNSVWGIWETRRQLTSTAGSCVDAGDSEGGDASDASRAVDADPAPPDAAALRPGAVFSSTKRFSAAEVATFATLTGDSNPIHISFEAAQRAGLPAPLLPGLLMSSLFPAIIGSNFPGALYLSQTLKFKHHALVGDSLTAQLTVERSSGSRVTFQTLCCSTTGQVLVEGTALALIRPAPAAADAAPDAAAAASDDVR